MTNTIKIISSIFLLVLLMSFGRNPDKEHPQSVHPVWSPDGAKIAFINNKVGVKNDNPVNFEDFTMNPDGSGIVRYTFNTEFEADINWSLDGKKIAVKSYRDENDEVYIIDLISKEQINITNHESSDGSPIWSINEELIFFKSERDSEKRELYSYVLTS